MSVLSDLEVGTNAILVALDLPPAVRNHLMYMGFVPDARITILRRAPAGDPTVYGIDGMEVALRRETASSIRVREELAFEEQPLAAQALEVQTEEFEEFLKDKADDETGLPAVRAAR